MREGAKGCRVKAPYAVMCGDARDLPTVRRLMDGEKAQVVITSPPYAAQREYDKSSGFEPIQPDKYIEWYKAVAENIATVLAPDGSYFLNIKEHAQDGQRHLYVKKLVIAHVEQWGWRFVDEFCWRNTANGDPGDLIFDPFGGSASTLVAALLTGRRGRMTELSPTYCDVAVSRLLKQDAKLSARLANGGASFDEARVGRMMEQEDAIKEDVMERLEARAAQ